MLQRYLLAPLAALLLLATPSLTFAQTGNVGIGTTTPTQTLDVNGNARLRALTTAGLVTTDADGNLSSQAQPTLGLTGQTLTLTSGSAGSSVTLPVSGAAYLSGSFTSSKVSESYFVSPALASDSILTGSGRRSNTVEATAPYIYGIRAPKSGTVQLSVTAVNLQFLPLFLGISFELYVNGTATSIENVLPLRGSGLYTASKRTFNLGATIAEGDIVSLKIRQGGTGAFPYCQVFTTVLIQ